mmetsp:Transcript_43608/g.112701  ORF Transcript_43608/g.112701 Transcript_43608/m.112701 type:complete len:216 (-) Transcript_43608:30-677(-)
MKIAKIGLIEMRRASMWPTMRTTLNRCHPTRTIATPVRESITVMNTSTTSAPLVRPVRVAKEKTVRTTAKAVRSQARKVRSLARSVVISLPEGNSLSSRQQVCCRDADGLATSSTERLPSGTRSGSTARSWVPSGHEADNGTASSPSGAPGFGSSAKYSLALSGTPRRSRTVATRSAEGTSVDGSTSGKDEGTPPASALKIRKVRAIACRRRPTT